MKRLVLAAAAIALVAAGAAGAVALRQLAPPGVKQGIGVRGEWLIVVRDASGKPVARRSFRNDLTTEGEVLLRKVLGNKVALGRWGISLDDAAGRLRCTASPSCRVEERLTAAPLEVRADGTSVVLSGTTTAVTTAATIASVSTSLGYCRSDVTPASCGFARAFGTTTTSGFTRRVLPAADRVPVRAGQTIFVRVTFTFGTLP